MADVTTLFPESYAASRARFREDFPVIEERWPGARLEHHRLSGDEDLTIDWIQAPARERQQKLLTFTTGEHGIEAYVGSAMLRLFLDEFLPRLNPVETGLLIVHAINPWGMKHRRRTNRANVDLNRNFVLDPGSLDRSFNPCYGRLCPLLNPEGPLRSVAVGTLAFWLGLIRCMASLGPGRLAEATLLGQYCFPQGVYYGGEALQEETQVLCALYREHIRAYEQVVHLDMHTGYGPRYQMSVVNSWMEPRDSAELERTFSYPLVVKANPAEFYGMRGDMIDYLYALVHGQFPHKRFYAASFEFGTLGDSLFARLRSLRILIFENRVHWFGARDPAVRARVAREFEELFAPREERWRKKAVADARQAFEGVLRAERLLCDGSATTRA